MTSLLLAGLLALVAADSDVTPPPSIIDQPSITYPSEVAEVPSPEDADPIATVLEEMSLRKKVAQLMVVTMAGSHQPSAEDVAYLKSYPPGAAIIRKILKPSYASVYVAKLRGVEQLTGIPLWVGTNIYRLTTADREELNEFIQLPSPLSLAAANDPATTEALAELLAQHLNLMGFNLHLGPSLDLAPSIKDAVGSVYNLGSDPHFIGDTFNITQRVFNDRGIIAVPLGFPGGGANRLEKSAAVLLTPVAQLPQQDLLPYHRVIANQAPLMHVGNTLVPTLDSSGLPACVSPVVLRQMLRTDLAYEGIVLAGPMDTQDVSGIIDPAEAAIRALTHGADMIMWDGADNQEMRAVDRITGAVDEGRLSEDVIDTALKRVLTYKFEHLMEQVAKSEKDAAPLERTRKLAEKVQAIEERAITIVQNKGNVLPLQKDKSMPIGITGTIGVEILHNGMEKHIKRISQQPITTARHVGEIKDFEIHRVTSHIRGIRTVVCVFGETDRPEGQVRLVRELKAKGTQVVVVLLGYPRNLPYLSEADAIVLAYCDSTKYSQTLASMADVLVGEGAIRFIAIDQEISVNVGEPRTFNAYDFIRVPAGRLPITLSKNFSVGQAVPYSPETAIKKLQWDFGDGKKSKEPRTVHAFKKPGNYPVNLSVTTQDGDTTHCTFHIVANGVQ